MATRIQSLFLVEAKIVVANNEDMFESIAFFDAANQPIPLDGIEFTSRVRADRRDSAPTFVGFATQGSVQSLPKGTPRGMILISGNVMGFYAPFSQRAARALPGDYVFDTLASADGIVKRVVDGTFTLIQGVT